MLAEKGWNLTLTCSNSLKEAEEVAKECNDLGAETLVLVSDVSDDLKAFLESERLVKFSEISNH